MLTTCQRLRRQCVYHHTKTCKTLIDVLRFFQLLTAHVCLTYLHPSKTQEHQIYHCESDSNENYLLTACEVNEIQFTHSRRVSADVLLVDLILSISDSVNKINECLLRNKRAHEKVEHAVRSRRSFVHSRGSNCAVPRSDLQCMIHFLSVSHISFSRILHENPSHFVLLHLQVVLRRWERKVVVVVYHDDS